jgi:hypothetical protein
MDTTDDAPLLDRQQAALLEMVSDPAGTADSVEFRGALLLPGVDVRAGVLELGRLFGLTGDYWTVCRRFRALRAAGR